MQANQATMTRAFCHVCMERTACLIMMLHNSFQPQCCFLKQKGGLGSCAAPFITRFRMFMLTTFGSLDVSFGSSNCIGPTDSMVIVTSKMHSALIRHY